MTDPEASPGAPLPKPPLDPPHAEAKQVWTTEELLGQQREVLIRHGDDLYRLRITRHGKLILYK